MFAIPIIESRRERLSYCMTISKNGQFALTLPLSVTFFAITILTFFVTPLQFLTIPLIVLTPFLLIDYAQSKPNFLPQCSSSLNLNYNLKSAPENFCLFGKNPLGFIIFRK